MTTRSLTTTIRPNAAQEAGRSHAQIPSPLGPLTLVAEDGLLCGVYFEDQRHAPPAAAFGERRPDEFAGLRDQFDAYFAGELTQFDVALAVTGSPFQRQVWAALRDIPYGETRSYGQVALTIGKPAASRAVGLANGRNPIGIIVPCHRVVGADGSLTGYGGGMERKQALLDLERRELRLGL
jgi:methylated-DNA-[protein]-cysteine S-methyltransferase